MRSIWALVCPSSFESALGKWLITPAMRGARSTRRRPSRHRHWDGEKRILSGANRHDPRSDEFATAPQVGRCFPAAHLFLDVELSNRLLHFRFQRHSEPE